MSSDFPSRLAARLYRGEGDVPRTREERRRENRAHILVYAALITVTLLLFGDLISVEARHWHNSAPSVPLERQDWKLLQNPPQAECAVDRPVGAGCPAAPENPALWRDGESRFEAKGLLKRKAKKDFWIGATFPPAKVAAALAKGANQLILGWVYVDYDLFIDGRWVLRGLADERQSTVIPIPFSVMDPSRPLRIALLLHADSEGGAPDYFASPWTEGLATAAEATGFRSANVFWRSAKPFGIFLLNVLFSVVFFFFWLSNKRKQEYIYFAMYGAVAALVQVKFMDIFRGAFDLPATHALELFLYTAEGGFGFLTALAFARGRQSFFRKGVPLLLIAPWSVMLLPLATGTRAHVVHFFSAWLSPSFYFAGAAVCLVQAAHLHRSPKRHDLGGRIRQLVLFAAGMALIGVLGICESQHLVSTTVLAFTSRFSQFSAALLLAVIAMQEYREERKLLEKSPVSKYHRRPQLPESVRGALLCVDLKGSEHLSQLSADATGDSGRIVRTCLSHMWGAVLAEKGTVLSTEGDGLHAFFDERDCPSPAESALRASDRIQERLDELARQLHAQGIHHGGDLGFRGGIAVGEIKPVWQEVDRVRVAGWSDTGTGKAFVESARLMDIERQTGAGPDASRVVVTAETAFALRRGQNLRGTWALESQQFVGKHNRAYLVSVYAPAHSPREESVDTVCVAG